MSKMIDAGLVQKANVPQKQGLFGLADKIKQFIWSIISFLKSLLSFLKTKVRGIVKGFRVLLRKTRDGIIRVTKNYTYEEEIDKWHEVIINQNIDENSIPNNIMKDLSMQEDFDLSEKITLALCD